MGHARVVRLSVACPDCDVNARLLVVGGRTRARCPRCEALFDVRCAECGREPAVDRLTGDDDAPACEACGDALALEATPVLDRGRVAVGEPRWGDVLLEESGGRSPYRDGQPDHLRVRRSPTVAKRLVTAWALGAAPAILPAAFGWWWAAAGWASVMGLTLVAGVSPIRDLEVSPRGVRIRRRGWRAGVHTVDVERIRRIGWAGRGARCHVFAQTEDRTYELLFDGLTPPQAEVLEGKIARLLGV